MDLTDGSEGKGTRTSSGGEINIKHAGEGAPGAKDKGLQEKGHQSDSRTLLKTKDAKKSNTCQNPTYQCGTRKKRPKPVLSGGRDKGNRALFMTEIDDETTKK